MDEQAILGALRTLPISVQVTAHSDRFYTWSCLERSGLADTLAGAMSAGLNAMIEQLAGDVAVIDDLVSKSKRMD